MFFESGLVFPLFIHKLPLIMASFDYSAEAELFFVRRESGRQQSAGYQRFAQAALAVRFAIEEIPPELLLGATLEVDAARFDCDGIRCLYDSADYPLPRRTVVGAGMSP